MSSRSKSRRHRDASRASPTYPEVGATARTAFPAGYTHIRRRVRVGTGAAEFARAGALVMSWGVQRGTGFDVHPGETPCAGGTFLLTVRLPRVRFASLTIPCRVVWTVAEPDRIGFAYGTLPGHPERGEESFVVTHDADDTVSFEIAAFSRLDAWYARLAAPVARRLQRAAIERYLRAVAAPGR